VLRLNFYVQQRATCEQFVKWSQQSEYVFGEKMKISWVKQADSVRARQRYHQLVVTSQLHFSLCWNRNYTLYCPHNWNKTEI